MNLLFKFSQNFLAWLTENYHVVSTNEGNSGSMFGPNSGYILIVSTTETIF